MTLIAKTPEVASLLTNPKVAIVTDDGRRWLRANPGRRFDAIVSNTTWHFRANVTNLLSSEFLDLIKRHLNPGGVFFYNTTESARVQRTGCLAFANGARFLNHMVVSARPIRWDFARWRRILETYRIDGRPVFDMTRREDRAELDRPQASLAADHAPSADRGLRGHPRPHGWRAAGHRRQYGQRVALLFGIGMIALRFDLCRPYSAGCAACRFLPRRGPSWAIHRAMT
jgi:SAM-dependent methyltransferase